MLIFKKIAMFVSAFMPLYFLLLVKIGLQLANNNLHFNVLNIVMLCFLFCMLLIGALGVRIATKFKKCKKINVLNAQNITEKHFLGYLSLFVLFALNFEIEYIAMAVVFVLIIAIVGVVYIKNKLFYINPTLNILGYSFYLITYYEGFSKEQKTIYALSKSELAAGSFCMMGISCDDIGITKS